MGAEIPAGAPKWDEHQRQQECDREPEPERRFPVPRAKALQRRPRGDDSEKCGDHDDRIETCALPVDVLEVELIPNSSKVSASPTP